MCGRHRIVFLGDSVLFKASKDVQGYPSRVANDYSCGKADVLIRGYPFGFCTHWLTFFMDRLFNQLLPSTQPTLWILSWGVSDMVIRPGYDGASVSLENYGANLRMLVETIRHRDPHGNIVIMSPIPVDRDRWDRLKARGFNQMTGFDFLPYERCVGYIKKAVNVAFLHGIPALDLMLRVRDWKELLSKDGCHLNDKGNEEVYKGLTDIIDATLPQWTPARIPGDHVEFDPLRPPDFRVDDECEDACKY